MEQEIFKNPQVDYTGYKTPLKPAPGGYGYLGALGHTKNGEKVECHICGELHASLAPHIRHTHKITAKEYRQTFKLNSKTALVSKEVSVKLRDSYEKNKRKFLEYWRTPEAKAKRLKQVKEQAKKNKGKKLSLEYRNKMGTCPDQLAEMYLTLKAKLNRVPSVKEFERENGASARGAVYWHYGSWVEFVKMMGDKSLKEVMTEFYSDEKYVEHLQKLYKKLKRTPRWSDLDRQGIYAASSVSKRFGTLNKARMKAGIPIVVEKRPGLWEETMDYDKYYY